MALLQNYIKRNEQADVGVQAYVDDVTARFSKRAGTEWGPRSEVTCVWELEYASKTATAVTILFLPIMMLAGHTVTRMTRVKFITFHYLEPSALRSLKRLRSLKKLILPCAILAMGFSGIVGVIALIILPVTFSIPPAPPGSSDKPIPPWAAALAVLLAGLLFAGAIKAQRRTWKMGEPQDSDCFRDQRIQLRDIRITAST